MGQAIKEENAALRAENAALKQANRTLEVQVCACKVADATETSSARDKSIEVP